MKSLDFIFRAALSKMILNIYMHTCGFPRFLPVCIGFLESNEGVGLWLAVMVDEGL